MRILMILSMFVGFAVFAQESNDAGVAAVSSFQGIQARDVMGSDGFDGTEMTMNPRFYRSGVPGDPCGEYSSGDFQYRTYEYSTGADGTATIDFDPGTCDFSIFVTFHLDSFNPANICENYLWSYGSSTAFTETVVFPANSNIVMVVSGVSNAPGVVCGPYTWAITGFNEGAAIPTLGEWGLIAFAALLLVAGVSVMIIRRRQTA